jgi:hypothetical protein
MIRITKTLALLLLIVATNARAEKPSVYAYGLLVGSNLPGENQEALHFAHLDAERMDEVLSEVGDYDPDNLRVLEDPDGDTLRQALTEISSVLTEHRNKEEQTSFLFYYSGHARADALSLGEDEIPLKEVRSILESLPATLKIVILDACQTGAFSRIKGADPAADFSHNSMSMLNTSGMAVIASSSAAEMSQESELLEGSFFTHHLVVGLRGAADGDQNGQVTLHEAYRYAYNETLVSTAGTAVGKQHATLETDLKGKGETVLTKPAEASAKLVLPATLAGDLLVNRTKDRTVMAEVHKAQGVEMGLAFPPDDYEVLVRQNKQVRSCAVRLAENQSATLDVNRCILLDKDPTTFKQSAANEAPKKDHFKWLPFLELSVGGLMTAQDDAYLRRLKTFQYEQLFGRSDTDLYYEAALGVHINRYIALSTIYSSLDHADTDEYQYTWYDIADPEEPCYRSFSWRAHRFAFKVRGQYPLLRDHLIPFVQLGIGGSIAKTLLVERSTTSQLENEETELGWSLSGGAGLIGMLYRSFGLLFQLEYIYAPAIDNLYGDHHNSGGFAFFGGARITL